MEDAWQGLIKPFFLGFVDRHDRLSCRPARRAAARRASAGRRPTPWSRSSVAVIAVDFFLTRLLITLMYRTATMLASERSPELAEALGPGSPIVVFDKVSLAFDDKVILRDVSFTLITGHTKIFLGASGAGKSTILKLILGLLKPDGGVIWVNGERVDGMSERELMKVRADLGMVFQEGALFDSLTVAENVGYKLYEESDMPLDEVRQRVEEVLGFVGLERAHRQDAVGAVGRPAAARGHRPRDVVQAAHPALRRADDRAGPDHRRHHRRRDHQAARPRERELDRRDASAARRLPHRDARGGSRRRHDMRHRAGRREEARRGRVHHAEGRPHRTSRGTPPSCGSRRIRI